MELQNWLTLETLGQFSTALVFLRLWVEYTKSDVDAFFGRWELRFPTSIYAFLMALVGILLPYHAFTTGLTFQAVYLDVINAFALSIGAGFMAKPKGDIQLVALPPELTPQDDEPRHLIGFHTDPTDEYDEEDDEEGM